MYDNLELGLTPLFGDNSGFMPPQLEKTNLESKFFKFNSVQWSPKDLASG